MMDNIWSEKKGINSLINVLIFLSAMHIFHYGQLLLPVICFVLFLDRNFKFYVNNMRTFIVLCVFAISFFIFSYNLGLYCVMGFFLPLAYYIGSNISQPNEEKLKKVILLISIAMASHLILNFIYELITRGIIIMRKRDHYDIWTQNIMSSTALATNMVFIFGCLYYLLYFEINKVLKYSGLICFIIVTIYNIALGRRTPLLILFVSLLTAFVADKYVFKNDNKYKTPKTIILIVLFMILMLCVSYYFDLFGCRKVITSLSVVDKFLKDGFSTERLHFFFEAIKLMPKYLWGGQKISQLIGQYIHDLWMDTYDFAGIIPFVSLWMYSFLAAKTIKSLFLNNKISSSTKVLIISLFAGIIIQLFLEPIMSGSSIFLIFIIMIVSCIESLNLER